LRFRLTAVTLSFFLLLAATAARADTVVLKSGGKITGTIEKETETEVVVRTDLGLMKIRKSSIKEILRDSGGSGRSDEAAPVAPAAPGKPRRFALDHVNPAVLPVVVSDSVFAVLKDGHLGAWSVSTGKRRWLTEVGRGKIAGLAADPAAVYLVTKDGHAARLHAANGQMVWIANPGGNFAGAPLIFRRGLFAFQRDVGLVGIETANGEVRGRLPLPVALDTPLSAAGNSILFGTSTGLLMSIVDDGKKLGGATETKLRWRGRPVATWLRTAFVTSEGKLVSFGTDRQKIVKRLPVPGLVSHPFATDAIRAYAEIDGALCGLTIVTGRVAWRTTDVPRVTAVAMAGDRLYATTAGNTVAAISRADGKLLWSSSLGGRAATPPIPARDQVLVLLANGRLMSFRADSDAPVPPPEETEKPRTPAEPRMIHSADGYSLTIPDGWSASENATIGAISLGIRPVVKSPRFDVVKATERDRRLLEVSAYLAVALTPAGDTPVADRAKRILADEKAAAARGGYTLKGAKLGEVTLGGTKWTTVSFEQVVANDLLEGTLRKITLVRSFGDGRNVWVEMKSPSLYAKVVMEDLKTLARSLRRETDYVPAEEVRVAEAAVAALNRGDLAALLPLLAEPLRERMADRAKAVKLLAKDRRVRLVLRMSLPRGSRREVRVRVDSKVGTDFAGLTLARESGRWVVIHLGGV